MKNILNKYISKIKECLNKNISFNSKILGITAIILIISLFISYNIGSSHKLNDLVSLEAQSATDKLKQSDESLANEIKSLTTKKDELNSVLSDKANSQKSMQEYNTKKSNYTNQISQLNTDIENLDSSIQQKQTELNDKKAAKEEEIRLAAEKAAEEAEVARQANMVWIGDTGTKYHHQYCRTLKGNKYQITLEEAKAQGRTACKVCY